MALALLRAMLIGVILLSEQIVQARRLTDSDFSVVLVLASIYAVVAIAAAAIRGSGPRYRAFAHLQPGLDVLFLTGLTYTSGGAFSDVRKAFFVIPLAAAFSERTRSTAKWSLIAVAAFTVPAILAGGHPSGAQNDWQRMTLNQAAPIPKSCHTAASIWSRTHSKRWSASERGSPEPCTIRLCRI